MNEVVRRQPPLRDGPLRFESIEQLRIPSLWINGGKDRSNPAANDISVLEAIRVETGLDITIQLYPNSNHDMVDELTGEIPSELFGNFFTWLSIYAPA